MADSCHGLLCKPQAQVEHGCTNLAQVAEHEDGTHACTLCFDIYMAKVEPACAQNRGRMPLQMTTSLQGTGALQSSTTGHNGTSQS